MSGIITEPIFLKTFPQMKQSNKSGAIQALVVAIYEIGCLFGALGMVAYGDVLGRRRSILVGASIMIVGAILQTAATGLPQMIVGRIVTGIGMERLIAACLTELIPFRREWDEYECHPCVAVRGR